MVDPGCGRAERKRAVREGGRPGFVSGGAVRQFKQSTGLNFGFGYDKLKTRAEATELARQLLEDPLTLTPEGGRISLEVRCAA